MVPVHGVEPGPLLWLPSQWWPYRHAVPVGAPEVTLPNGVMVRYGLCGLATVARKTHWPRCPVCVRLDEEYVINYRKRWQ